MLIYRMQLGYQIYELKNILKYIEDAENNKNYDSRNKLILKAQYLSNQLGYSNGIRFDETVGTDWYVVCIVLPGDQEISWHLPCTNLKYTRYSTEEKYNRCRNYSESDIFN